MVLACLALTAFVAGCGTSLIPLPATPAPTPSAEPTDDMIRAFPAPWVLYEVRGRELDIGVQEHTSCVHYSSVDVIESSGFVEIVAWVDVPLAAEGCFTPLSYERVTVSLDLPLGSRQLLGCMIEDSGSDSTRESCLNIVR